MFDKCKRDILLYLDYIEKENKWYSKILIIISVISAILGTKLWNPVFGWSKLEFFSGDWADLNYGVKFLIFVACLFLIVGILETLVIFMDKKIFKIKENH